GIQVDALYVTFLNRVETPAERAGWVAAFQNGMSEIQISQLFLSSAEYQAAHASDASFIDSLYQNVLGRVETPSEQAGWLSFLQSGGTRDQTEVFFLTATEHYQRIVDLDYFTLLGRGADPGGEAAATNFLVASNTLPNGAPQAALDQVAETLLASDEFY